MVMAFRKVCVHECVDASDSGPQVGGGVLEVEEILDRVVSSFAGLAVPDEDGLQANGLGPLDVGGARIRKGSKIRIKSQPKSQSVSPNQIIHFPIIWWLLPASFWSFYFLDRKEGKRVEKGVVSYLSSRNMVVAASAPPALLSANCEPAGEKKRDGAEGARRVCQNHSASLTLII